MSEQIPIPAREERIVQIVEGFKEALLYQGELLADLPVDPVTLHALGKRAAFDCIGVWRRHAAPPPVMPRGRERPW